MFMVLDPGMGIVEPNTDFGPTFLSEKAAVEHALHVWNAGHQMGKPLILKLEEDGTRKVIPYLALRGTSGDQQTASR